MSFKIFSIFSCTLFRISVFYILYSYLPFIFIMQEYMKPMSELIKLTSRYFYPTACSIVMDMLMSEYILDEDEICSLMCISTKEYNKIIIKLKEDRLIHQESKIINYGGTDNRQIVKQVYYLDYREVKEVIKYKIYMMSKVVEEQIKSKTKEQSYICKGCSKIYNILELQSTMDVSYNFKCEECDGEIVEHVEIEEENNTNHKVINIFLKRVVELLKVLDKYEIERADYFQMVEQKKKKIKLEVKEEKEEKEEEEIIEEIILDSGDEDVHFENNEENKDDKVIGEIITVNGVEKTFEELTEEDKEKMTEEEYEKYYEIYSKYN
ncbi:Transcription initiation factor IIE alpha subunit [Spraguea lophii 42_110]|uniref:Transcription initiation factor IIE alpha subunit n=1 Tax=Spraguea lophii (strain 42_110) TaxID=1358809 RepID=S7W7I7_SPRLO|nr:Transcription initiation factor IIE alpha subunit [Spraguea lophii 42_110]